MALSNSFHSSCKNHAIKDSAKLNKIQYHNERGYFDLSYDENKIVDIIGSSSNIVSDTKKYINDTFGKYVEEYNNKQKREDRKIKTTAFEHFEKDKGLDIANESIFQIGDKEFWDKFRIDEVVGKNKNGDDIIIHSYPEEVKKVMNDIFKKQAETYEKIYLDENTRKRILNKITSAKDGAETFLNSLDKEKKKEYDKALKKDKAGKKEYYSSLDSEEKKNFINYSKATKDINIIKKLKLIERIKENQMNIKVVNLTAHYDEYSAHAHGISVCSASNYKTGLSSRIAKSVVLNKFSLEVIQERLNEIAKEEIGKYPELFKDETIKEKEKGRRFNYSTEQYKRMKVIKLEENIKTLESSRDDLLVENEKLKEEKELLQQQIQEIEEEFNKIEEKLEDTKSLVNEIENFNGTKEAKSIVNFFETVHRSLQKLHDEGRNVNALSIPISVLNGLERALAPFVKLKEKVKEIVSDFNSLHDKIEEAKGLGYIKAKGNRTNKTASKQAERSREYER